ncbi:monooxygenase component MmoB/DmpM (plasmid) [Xanthobacter versatilis]|uniref:Alkene monooxygenase system, effector subunit n=1 Tax=Xanthobacter autotrophicus (strain ATCC BAA-1158 / Py2) TaxID=78245 RepID=XAMOD_XANP2|nr:RecName: Full=Alkene monooxygenase system, effector subunit; AltName: Full=Alkene monooxygenase 11 kDa subunit [Xanthobacter autotrophicus Py2]ABS70071.1 monooxygenase component MmoB/DmpM [Xanthobacter autotrophicus Py2]CAA09914.1 coupling/effector protein [Xanthobacter autotrophicus Py2]
MSNATVDDMDENLVGPVIRAGDLADAVIDAVIADNPGKEVHVIERGDYVRIHTDRDCRLTRASIEQALGRSFVLAAIEAEMSSFKGRMSSSDSEMRWYYKS